MNLRSLPPLACSLMLSACSLWPWSSDKGPQPTPLTSFQQSAQIRVAWSGRAAALNDAVLLPAAVGDSVFAAGNDGTVVRWDGGREVWRSKAAGKLIGGVGADASTVVVSTESGDLIALDAEKGEPRWQVPVGGEVLGAPVVTSGLVVARVGDNQLVAFDPKDGKRRWVYQRAQAPLSLRAYSSPAIYNDLVVTGFSGGKLVAVTLAGGFPRWEATIALPRGATELERMADVVGAPVVRGDSACVAAYQGRVACVNKDNGVVQWTRDIPSAVGVDADDKSVYVTDEVGAVYALDIRTGASAWKQDKLLNRTVGRPIVVGEFVAVSDAQGWVHLLDKRDGRFVARTELDGAGITAPPVSYSGGFALQARNGSVYGLTAR